MSLLLFVSEYTTNWNEVHSRLCHPLHGSRPTVISTRRPPRERQLSEKDSGPFQAAGLSLRSCTGKTGAESWRLRGDRGWQPPQFLQFLPLESVGRRTGPLWNFLRVLERVSFIFSLLCVFPSRLISGIDRAAGQEKERWKILFLAKPQQH